jgi:hypothetical protein
MHICNTKQYGFYIRVISIPQVLKPSLLTMTEIYASPEMVIRFKRERKAAEEGRI